LTYEQTLEYLYAKLPMFSRVGAAAIKTDVTNTIRICEAIGNPHLQFRSIHIAGTNGKGSTSHMLAAALQTAGYKTGLYTSPHLRDFRERIKVNGEMIEQNFVVDFTEKIIPVIEEIQPSFFEITVALAFAYFAEKKIDIAVVEAGLGGRLDSTNVISPELAVITNIGWDHMNILGDSLEKIAAEKAGIIKKGVPVVVGAYDEKTAHVFESHAQAQRAELIFADRKFTAFDWKFEKHHLITEITTLGTDHKNIYQLDLTGLYQIKNLMTVLESVHQLNRRGWNISENHLQHALKHVKKLTGLHGRWETIREHPSVILDVAHNEDGIRELVAQLELTSFHQLRIVIGMVKDKEINKVLGLLPAHAVYYFTKAQIPRALPEQELAHRAASFGLKGTMYADVNTALKTALSQSYKDDLILVCGSVFVAGEVEQKSLQVP
jgi:dihydrofolate synthase / folylpolyglutamate synthase